VSRSAPDPNAPAISRSYVVVLRLLLLGLAMAAVIIAVVVAGRGRGGDEAGARYACPMHPEVVAAQPGQCPICRMALELVTRGPAPGPHAAMGGMVDTAAVDNVRKHKILEFVRVHSLLPHLRELRGAAWVESDRTISAIYYDDQIEAFDADEAGSFSLTRAPSMTFAVRRTADPVVRWDKSTSRVRFRLDAAAGKQAASLEPGQVGWLEVARKPRDVLGVPTSALLQSPEGPYVLVPLRGGRFEKRPVELGETFIKQSFAVVLSGLQKHELVVSKAAFFVDADRRLGVAGAATEAGMAPP